MKYRPEVDGLRAIAVLPVIVFHAGFTWMRGGFVGVDIFFVISGYLITTIILSELDNGQFSIAGFYERRARRILPALFLVLACSLLAAYLLLLPDQLIGFSKSLAGVVLFISNVYFRSEVNYFARASEQEPLLHTWSLAVEEQYYLVFPLLAMLIWKKGAKVFLFTALLIAIASFTYADRQSLIQPDKVFFETLTRIWELFVGSLAAAYILRWRTAEPGLVVAEVCGVLGLGLIAWACLHFDQATPFPGRYAIAPTLGAALVILFASPSTYTGRLLGCKVVVGIGLICYSAYLWHQPIFAFARILSPANPSSLEFATLTGLSLGLAYLTWRFVEQPFRNRSRFGRNSIFTLSIVGIAVFSVLSLLGYQYKGWPSRFSSGNDADLIVSLKEREHYVVSRYQSHKEEAFDSVSSFKLLIVGDSFSQDLVNILHEGRLIPNAQIRVRYIPAPCQVYRGEETIADLIESRSINACKKDYYIGIQEQIAEADAVFVAASWRDWSAERLPVTLERLGISEKENYLVFGRKSLGYINRAAYIGMSSSAKSAYLNRVTGSSTTINSKLAKTIGDSHFIDMQALLCGSVPGQCPIFDQNGALLSHDGVHLTQAGAAYLGARLANTPTFARLAAVAAK
jgi:peptidoglycan/LPS O-acetylase OafA/YrhL